MSSYVDATASAVEHCESMSALHPDLAEKYTSISSFLTKKLYHQLTVSIMEFVNSPGKTLRMTAEGGNSYLALYDKVVLAVDKKLNQLSLARIASSVADSLLHGAGGEGDGVAAQGVLENLLTHKSRLGAPATLYAESKLALSGLNLIQRGDSAVDGPKHLESTKGMLKQNAKSLDAMEDGGGDLGSDSDAALVHAAHYECAMVYRKAVGPPEAYYREAVQYLHYTPLDSLESEERVVLATDLSMAALTGEGVYNFGEVVQNPILRTLDGTKGEWLIKLMEASASGDVSQFKAVSTEHAADIAAQPALTGRADAVKEKITLLALVNMVFERPSSERTLSFDDIAERIQVPVDAVEPVIMRALSLGLIKGCMDQVDGTVNVTWVMPRVLDDAQLKNLAGRFGEWAVTVSKTKDYVAEQIPTFA